MTAPDLLALAADIRARLTAPGAAFEIRTEDVRGQRLDVFAHRRRSLSDWLIDSAKYGDRECLVQNDRRICFAEHLELVGGVVAHLRDVHHVEPGDRVAIFAANSPDWLVAFWAI